MPTLRNTPPQRERRSVPCKVEMRAAKEGSGSLGTLFGYASKFNTMSQDLGGWTETVLPGAFTACMGDDVRCLRNHNDEALLGRSSSGTLRITQDNVGLYFECDLPDTTSGRDTAASIARGDMTGCSIQFVLPPYAADEWSFEGERPVHTIRAFARLYDVGPVTFPAFRDTEVDCRSLETAQAHRLADAKAKLKIVHDRVKTRLRVAAAAL